jgi:hypothetical protein
VVVVGVDSWWWWWGGGGGSNGGGEGGGGKGGGEGGSGDGGGGEGGGEGGGGGGGGEGGEGGSGGSEGGGEGGGGGCEGGGGGDGGGGVDGGGGGGEGSEGTSLIPISLGLKVSSPVTIASVLYSRITAYSESPPPKSSPAVHRKCSMCLPVVLTYAGKQAAAQTSASWLPGGLSQRQIMPQAATSFGRPRLISWLGRAGRPVSGLFSTERLYSEGVLEPRHGEASLAVDRVVRVAVVGQHLHVRSGERAVECPLAGGRVGPIDAGPLLRVRAHRRSVRGVTDVVGVVGGQPDDGSSRIRAVQVLHPQPR